MNENLYKSSLSLKLHNRPNLLNSRSIHSPNNSSRAANIVYIFLKGQETVLSSIYEKLAVSPPEAKYRDEVSSSLQCLLSSNYSSFFQNLNNLITTMQIILSFQDIPPDIERIAQQLLTTSFSMNSMLNNFDMKKTSANTSNNQIPVTTHLTKSKASHPQAQSPPPSAAVASRPPPMPHKNFKTVPKMEAPPILTAKLNNGKDSNSNFNNSYSEIQSVEHHFLETVNDKNEYLDDKQQNNEIDINPNINRNKIKPPLPENNHDGFLKCINETNNFNNSNVSNNKDLTNDNLMLSDDSFDGDEYDDMSYVVCRICDEKIPVDKFDEHTKLCADLYRSATFVNEVNEKLKTMLKEIKGKYLDEKWPGRLNSAVNVFIPVLTATIMIENVIAIDLSDPDAADELKAFSQLFIFYSKSPRQIEYDLQHIFKPLIDAKLKAANAIVQSNIQLDFVKKFTVKQPLISDFELVKRISSGAFARVFLAKKKSTQDIYAIKVTPKSSLTQKNQVKRILAEKDILLQFSNPHIVSFFYSIIGKNNLYLIMEFLPGGDLYSLLQNIGSMDESTAKTYSLQIIHALKYLREKGIIHRDLKPDNILIAKNGFLKLTDFGLSFMGIINRNKNTSSTTSPSSSSSSLSLTQSTTSPSPSAPYDQSTDDSNLVQSNSLVGTPDYIAPEILLNRPHSFAADLWSLGVMIYEFVCGEPPFHGKTEKETHEKIIRGRYTIDPDLELSDELIDLLARLLKPNPTERIGASNINELIEHPWFADADVNSVPFTPDLKSKDDTNYFECRYDLTNEDDKDILEDMTTNYNNSNNDNQVTKITGYNSNSALTKSFNDNIKSLPPKLFVDSLLNQGGQFYNNNNNSSLVESDLVLNESKKLCKSDKTNSNIDSTNSLASNNDYDEDASENESFHSSLEKLPKFDQIINQNDQQKLPANNNQKLPQLLTDLPPPPPTQPNLSPPPICKKEPPFLLSTDSNINNNCGNSGEFNAGNTSSSSSSSSFSSYSSSSVNCCSPPQNSSSLNSAASSNIKNSKNENGTNVSNFPRFLSSSNSNKYDTYDTYDNYDKYDNRDKNDKFDKSNEKYTNKDGKNSNSFNNNGESNSINNNISNTSGNFDNNKKINCLSHHSMACFPPIPNKKPSFPNSVKMPTMSGLNSLPIINSGNSSGTANGGSGGSPSSSSTKLISNFTTPESEKIASINSATLEVKFESVSIQSLVTTNQRMAEKARRRRSLSFDIAKGGEVPRRNSADDSKKFFQLIHSNANEETPSMLCDSLANTTAPPNTNGLCKH